ncbi:MAG: GNAT family N-acetyltransferase [Acidobacteria bacterium]|nr:GNAT family N-acetyltransferase [Acidobacteriota bacterium]
MRLASVVTARKVVASADRDKALAVVEAVYRREKRWIADVSAEVPADAGSRPDRSWFLVTVNGRPAGVIRLVYDPPLELPAELGVTLEPDVDLDGLRRRGRFVDIGRFMIVPRYRRNIRVALRLMRAAIVEVVERGYTHFLTSVFADDPHSPLGFHTRVLGFERIGSHRTGELACASVRILLILDIARAYQRLQRRRNLVWKELAESVRDTMERRLLTRTV